MASDFQNSIFYQILLDKKHAQATPISIMGGVSGSRFQDDEPFHDKPFVIFDFETTGLDTRQARIIEIGAIKYKNRKEVARFSQLIDPGMKVSSEITKITGIDNGMLKGQPPIQDVLPAFHEFLRGSVGVAHNAEFDMGMLYHESNRLGISCDYTLICSLKLARALVKIESRSLDSLARHYKLTFQSRHRSIGDILVTADVLWNMFDENKNLQTFKDLLPYREPMPGQK